jgi:hypothetical protein
MMQHGPEGGMSHAALLAAAAAVLLVTYCLHG